MTKSILHVSISSSCILGWCRDCGPTPSRRTATRCATRSFIPPRRWWPSTGCGRSQIAEQTGIGRATLYKYFPDVEAILHAWHQRQITGHLQQLAEARDQAGDAGQRLEAVLEAYAGIARQSHGHHDAELAAFLHRGQQVGRAEQQLRDMLRDLLTEAAKTSNVRDDIAPDELASYCLHALAAASTLPSTAAVRRLVTVTLAGMRPPR
jgi:AcrR family transcriptional regulator